MSDDLPRLPKHNSGAFAYCIKYAVNLVAPYEDHRRPPHPNTSAALARTIVQSSHHRRELMH